MYDAVTRTPTRRKPIAPRKKGQTWCGPFALAMLTNLRSYEAAEELIRSEYPKYKGRGIKGTYHWEIAECIRSQGVRAKPAERPAAKTTLTQWYKNRTDKKGCYLVQTTSHFLIVHSTMFIDNQCDDWVSFNQLRREKRSIVKRVYEITRPM